MRCKRMDSEKELAVFDGLSHKAKLYACAGKYDTMGRNIKHFQHGRPGLIYDSWLYGNPETIAIRKQEEALRKARACGDCMHKRSIEFRGEVVHHCIYKRHQYGKRCELYEVKKD